MPIYEYECLNCGDVQETVQKFNDAPLTTCKKCGGNLKKMISNSSFVLKGTGWYKTDYASKPSGTGKTSEDKKEKKTETKTDTKTDSKAATTTKA
ncbi:MAG: zinc ribbon domain-containing protein [Nitrospirae bacterium]|nr:zinc ribbon domain-containing protein [Nitrospirota bacterium]